MERRRDWIKLNQSSVQFLGFADTVIKF